jgi:hypothetical protein
LLLLTLSRHSLCLEVKLLLLLQPQRQQPSLILRLPGAEMK